MDNFYVITINNKGIPGKMVGPATWSDCIDYLLKTVKGLHKGGILTEQEVLDLIDVENGEYASGDDAIYIVGCEPL